MPRFAEKCWRWISELFGLEGDMEQARFDMEQCKEYKESHWSGPEVFVEYDWRPLWFKTRGWPLYVIIMVTAIVPMFIIEAAIEWIWMRWMDDEYTQHERSFRYIADIPQCRNLTGLQVIDLRRQVDVYGEFQRIGNMIHGLGGWYGKRLRSMLYAECPEKERCSVGVFVRNYSHFTTAQSAIFRLERAVGLTSAPCRVWPPAYDRIWRPKTLERLTVAIDILIVWIGYLYFGWWRSLLTVAAWWSVVIHVKAKYHY